MRSRLRNRVDAQEEKQNVLVAEADGVTVKAKHDGHKEASRSTVAILLMAFS